MTQVVTVRPVPGRLILMPDRGFQAVPEAGAKVYLDAFYTRAVNQGDLEIVPDIAPTATVQITGDAPSTSIT